MGKKKRRAADQPAKSPKRRRVPLLPVSLPELHRLRPRRDAAGLALLFAGALALYAASTPRTVMLEDDGGFIVTAAHAGVAHAPGYPMYVLLGWLASLVPFGSVAWRVHTASGLMGALTCGCIAWLVLRRTGNRPAAYLAAAALAVSEHFWSQAIIADVYTTNTAVVFLTLTLMQEAAVRRSGRLWVAAAVVYGLGLANHYPLLILGSPILLAFAVAAGRDFRARIPSLLLLTTLTAAALYGWMVWRSHQPGPINFFGPFHSWGAFLSFVDRSIYAGIDDNVNAGLADKLSYAGHFVAQAVLQFGVLGSLVALWGAFTASRTGWRLGLLGEALTFVSSSFLLIALLGFNYEHLMIAAFRPYPLVAYGLLALWLGYGMDALMDRVRDMRTSAVPAVWAAAVLAVAALGIWNGRVNYRPHDTFAEEQAQTILDLVDEDGVLVLYQDAYVGPLAYLHWVAGRRPDVRMLEAHGLLFSDRVVQPSWTPAQRDAAWADFFRTVERPAYFQWRGSTLSAVGQRHLGFLRRADPNVAPGTIGIELDDTAKAYFKRLLAMSPPADAWIAYHRNQMLETYGEFLGLAQASDFPPFDGYIADVLPLAEDNYWALVGMAGALVPQNTDRSRRLASGYLQKARRLAGDDRSKTQRAALLYLEGRVAQQRGDAAWARALFRESVRIDRAATNQAYRALRELRAAGRSGRGTRLATSPHGFRPFDRLKAPQAQGPRAMDWTLSLSKGRGWSAKAKVTSGFVSMFRQAQHIASSTN